MGLGPQDWNEFLDTLENWWLDCTEFVHLNGHHKVGPKFRSHTMSIVAWCYDNTPVDPSRLADLSLYIQIRADSGRYHRFGHCPPISLRRIAITLEKCVMQVAYLRDRAARELEPKQLAVRRKNDERNQWMYEQRRAGKSLGQIQLDLADHPDWCPIDSPAGIQAAIDRYCELNSFKLLRARR